MRLVLTQFALLVCATSAACADTVINNANGYTLNGKNELVRFVSLAFDDKGRIIAIGSAAEVARQVRKARHLDLRGATVLPGLIDAHGHVFDLGEQLPQLDLDGRTSLNNVLGAAADYARANPDRSWLRGHGWTPEIWKLGLPASGVSLDRAVVDRPMWIERADGHAGWANSQALRLAGITDATPDPAGGHIVRGDDGKATGVLLDAAKRLVERVLPRQAEGETREALDRALAHLAQLGLTGVHDAGVTAAQDRLYRDYAGRGKLSTRIYGMIGGAGTDFDALSAGGPLSAYGHGLYALRAVALRADSARGDDAAMLAPYSQGRSGSGRLLHKDAALRAMMEKAMKAGYQVSVQAAGDAASRQALDAFGVLVAPPGSAAQRHRIEHAGIVAPADIARFRSLGIIVSMQPTRATSLRNTEAWRVGPTRSLGIHAWRSFLGQGSRIACGSDFPLESANPFAGIHAAVMRQESGAVPAAGGYPQAMSLKEAFRCFTLDAAYAGQQEDKVGSLEVGKLADFIVIDQDLFAIPFINIGQTRVLQTWVGGRQVYLRQ